MRLPNPNPQRPQTIRYGLGVEIEALPHGLKRQAFGVELDGKPHLRGTHLAWANCYPSSVEDGTDGGAVQAELASDVVHRLALLVRRDDLRLPFVIQVTLRLDAWPWRDRSGI